MVACDRLRSAIMDREEVVRRTEQYVREELSGDASGHDWWHVDRVRVLAKRLGREEGADLFVVELAALLHDIADWKLHDGDTGAGPKVAAEWLQKSVVGQEVIDHVCDIVGTLSFKGEGVPTPMATLEGQVVQDADRLDAIGAIGIARTFAYGGARGRLIHDPEVAPHENADLETYLHSHSSTTNHFHEKLFLLKDRMNTESARRLAAGRHSYMKSYLDRFMKEWEGES
jgi:uncharacterized protein